jgi:hypothetical protein
MSDVFDDLIDRQSLPNDPARALRLSLDLLRRLEAALFDRGIVRVMQQKVILENVKRPQHREHRRQQCARDEHQNLFLAEHWAAQYRQTKPRPTGVVERALARAERDARR